MTVTPSADPAISQDGTEATWSSPPPPEQMQQLDFLLGSVKCVGEQGEDGSEPTVMFLEGSPILGGHYYNLDVTWPGMLIGRWIFGWSPVDSAFNVIYFADAGMQGTATSAGWQDGKLVVTGSYAVAAKNTHMQVRDVFTRTDDDRFVIESSMKDGERWVPYDTFNCHRSQGPHGGTPAAARAGERG